MKKGYSVYYIIKNWGNNNDTVTIFFTENKEFAIKYVEKYNNILVTWKNYFLNTDTKSHQFDKRDIIDSIIGCYYKEVFIRGEITTREFSKKVLAIQDMAKKRAYELHLAKGGDECYGGYNSKWDNFGIRVLLNEVTQRPYPMTYERHVYYDYLDMPEEEWQKLLDNIKKEYVKSLDENNPILKRKKELREEITQRQEELLELELKTL